MGRSSEAERGDTGSFGPDGDDSGCHILHVDMDAFFASVEVRARPELRGKPVIVGGTGLRGVVSAASYEARAFGVRSAMPMARARGLCPQAIVLPPDFTAYQEASRAVMAIFADVTPLVEPLSVDEAFLDVAGAERLFGRPAAIAVELRRRIQHEQRLTCSVGVAPTKFVAKLASTRSKPDGLLVIPVERVLEFLHPLPITALWGVGERSAEQLRRFGLRFVGDVAQAPIGLLRSAVGQAAAAHLQELAWGRDPRVVDTRREEKSIGAEVTFPVDVTDPVKIRQTLLALSGTVGARLRKAGQSGRTIAVKVRYSDFHTINRSRTLPAPTDVTREIFETGWSLFEALQTTERIRLIGVRVEGLGDADDQVRQLFLGEPERGWREAEAAVDAASARYGRSAIRPASLLGREESR
ncbi:DNA polymerase-4 [Allocatelliglobosispora scoriae]|uniref:DNA polymerase IV n=1 Tax=Allocatelliglobosispora scoriae TaxID=643052 RepID=A0A841BRN6_9ACTN|nr:DNA polymerase IV [Allocatelliglobosispora scoriae]MBB5869392.1 DNA polymerase-4 [Allocatelliglobosispora scoriae]